MIPHNIWEVAKSTLSAKMFICVLQTSQGQQTIDLNLSEKPTQITSEANLLFIKMPFFICRSSQSHILIMRSVYNLQNLSGTSRKSQVGLDELLNMLILWNIFFFNRTLLKFIDASLFLSVEAKGANSATFLYMSEQTFSLILDYTKSSFLSRLKFFLQVLQKSFTLLSSDYEACQKQNSFPVEKSISFEVCDKFLCVDMLSTRGGFGSEWKRNKSN